MSESAIKQRVVASLGLLLGSKIILVQVPFFFKHIVDTLNAEAAASAAALDPSIVTVAPEAAAIAPVLLVAGYGIARASATGMHELRNTVFATVTHTAVRQTSRDLLDHLLNLDMNFHYARKTGALMRVIDRGGRSITMVLNTLVFRVFPTALELGLVCWLLASSCGAAYAGVCVSTLAAYTAFTIAVTQWRTQIRKNMIRLDNEANSKAVDTLLNFETVKYFNNEKNEVAAYEESLLGCKMHP